MNQWRKPTQECRLGRFFPFYLGFVLIDPAIAKEAFINVNDGTNEGLAYEGKNIFTVQFHPEACPGPQDSGYLFDRFMDMMKGAK